jgi:hypothetical protein
MWGILFIEPGIKISALTPEESPAYRKLLRSYVIFETALFYKQGAPNGA